ncbi:MAG TPA: 4Fe-4S dicluster domain-containing protein [Tepidisphaeraceae bacterium]|nr:4Fe-4S dicluster domain-containing protein [Tepidisphaeraceae bacterium]
MTDDDKPMNRRKFFRAGLAELLKPLSKAARPLEQLAHQIGRLEDIPATPAPTQQPAPEIRKPQNTVSYSAYAGGLVAAFDPGGEHSLRPPGARDEQDFRNICSRCGNCVHACPVHAIQLDHSGTRGAGVPFIDPDASACVMCDGMPCMTHCPSSAILSIAREEVDMGTAAWHEHQCVRTTQGEDCTMCVDHCPVGPSALELVGNAIVVKEAGCTGCGYCQQNCPTTPKSITVTPKSKRDAIPAD